jgi:hypothetical protein
MDFLAAIEHEMQTGDVEPWEIIEAGVKAAQTNMGRARIECINLHDGYAERGYTQPESGMVALGNWNKICEYDKEKNQHIDLDDAPTRIGRLLERAGVGIEWDDEWTSCDSCNKIFRTTSSGPYWMPSGYVDDAGAGICKDCTDPVDYLESREGVDSKANCLEFNPEDYDYVLAIEDLEYGLHVGQTDNPHIIGKNLRRKGIYRYLFSIDHNSQFDTGFCVYIHKSEYDADIVAKIQTEGEDPAEVMKKSLSGKK